MHDSLARNRPVTLFNRVRLRSPRWIPMCASVFVLETLSAQSAQAQALTQGASDGCLKQGKHIAVSFQGTWPADFDAAILRDLNAGLQSQELNACAKSDTRNDAISEMTITRHSNESVEIAVGDSLTNKSVSRTIRLETKLESSSALVIAVAADELLRATWAELSLPPRGQVSAPRRTSEKTPRDLGPSSRQKPTSRSDYRLALRFAFDAFPSRTLFYGADLSFGATLAPRVEWMSWVGGRFGLETNDSEWGSVSARGLVMGTSLRLSLLRRTSFSLGPIVSLQGAFTGFSGHPDDRGIGDNFSAWSLSGMGGISLRWQWRPLFLGIDTQLGAPFIGVAVTDGDEIVGGLQGLQWSSAVSVGIGWGE